ETPSRKVVPEGQQSPICHTAPQKARLTYPIEPSFLRSRRNTGIDNCSMLTFHDHMWLPCA
ncbi:MAG TPA: hypothetical protein VFC19_30240, partial [Candidatus Limnocylindrales bacterium]|nr:hypothetical protein [Candidatus Limnocylindrales bacterium]